MMNEMRLNTVQHKSLAEFGTTVAAAWFSAGIIAPFFTKPKSIIDGALFLIIGMSMTFVSLYFSLLLLKGIKS